MLLSRIKDLLIINEEKVFLGILSLTKWACALTISGWLVWSGWVWQDKAIVGVIGVLLLSNLLLLSKYLKWKAKEEKVQRRLKDERSKGPQPLYLDQLSFRMLRTLAES